MKKSNIKYSSDVNIEHCGLIVKDNNTCLYLEKHDFCDTLFINVYYFDLKDKEPCDLEYEDLKVMANSCGIDDTSKYEADQVLFIDDYISYYGALELDCYPTVYEGDEPYDMIRFDYDLIFSPSKLTGKDPLGLL